MPNSRLPAPRRWSRLAVSLAVTVGLVACGSVGKGVAPVRMELQPFNGNIGDASTRIFQCFQGSVGAVVFFSDGSAGDFSQRAHWTSSDPSVVRVSNGDIPVPNRPGLFYARGTLVGVSPGSATITATYVTLKASVDVTVVAPSNLEIRKIDQNVAKPVSSVTIAPGSTQDLTVVGDFGGVERDLQTQATWSFANPDTSVATIGTTTGRVTGVAAGGPLTATASFEPCSLTASVPVTVTPIKNLLIQPQFGSDPLIVGDYERFDVFADFGNGPEQDLSRQATLSSSDTALASFNSAAAPNYLFAASAGGPVTISASFGNPAIDATPVQVNLVSANLRSFSIAPAEASVTAASVPMTQYPGSGSQVVHFTALGRFDNGMTQDVTNVVVWSSSNPSIGVVNNGLSIKGFAAATGALTGSVTISAQDNLATENPLASAKLDVLSAPTP